MKKVLLIVFLFIITDITFPQSSKYHKFPTSNAVWREYSETLNSPCIGYQCIIGGDTNIKNLHYNKIQVSGVIYATNGSICSPNVYVSTFNYYKCAIREDTINKKVFVVLSNDSTESLLYDFNITLNDTLPYLLYNNPMQDHNYVSLVDSVLVGTEYHKRFGISAPNWYNPNYVYLIEGIGSTFGLIGCLSPPFEGGSQLLCFMQNGDPVWSDGHSVCDLVSVKENKKISIFSIYPNPFSTTTKISLDKTYENIDISILDLQGEIIKRKTYKNHDILTLDRTGLENGLYFLRITLNDKIIETKKIFISD